MWKEVAEKWQLLNEKKKEIEEEEKQCRNQLITLAGNRSSFGCGVRLTQYQKRGRVAYEKIPELSSIDLEKYREPTVAAWRLSSIK